MSFKKLLYNILRRDQVMQIEMHWSAFWTHLNELQYHHVSFAGMPDICASVEFALQDNGPSHTVANSYILLYKPRMTNGETNISLICFWLCFKNNSFKTTLPIKILKAFESCIKTISNKGSNNSSNPDWDNGPIHLRKPPCLWQPGANAKGAWCDDWSYLHLFVMLVW